MKYLQIFSITGLTCGLMTTLCLGQESTGLPTTPDVDTTAPAAPMPEAAPPAPAPVAEETGNSAAKAAQFEQVRRQEIAILANRAVGEGDRLAAAGELDAAVERYQYVLNNVSASGPSAAVYQRAAQGAALVKLKQAEEARANKDYIRSNLLITEAKSLAPNNPRVQAAARQAESDLERVDMQKHDPQSRENNPVLTREFMDKLAQVQKLFFEGDRFFETGQYDKSKDRYLQILALDPYNKAARNKIERLEKYKYKAGMEARQSTKRQAMYEVQQRWSENVPVDYAKPKTIETPGGNVSNVARMMRKLENIRIPSVSFVDVSVEDVVNKFLIPKSRELDPEKEGINFVLKLEDAAPPAPAPAAGGAPAPPPPPAVVRNVTLNLSNVPLIEVLKFITNLTNLKFKVEEYAVFILPSTGVAEVLQTRTFSVPAGFFTGGLTDNSGTVGAGNKAASVQIDVKRQLTDLGVEFGAGSSAAFLRASSKLVVKNAPEQLDVISALIENFSSTETPQIEIEAKFAEFTEDALKELSVNYFLSVDGFVGLPNGSLVDPTTGLAIPSYFGTQAAGLVPGLSNYIFPGLGGRYSAASALRVGRNPNQVNQLGQGALGGLTANGLDALLLANPASNVSQPTNPITGLAMNPNDPNVLKIGVNIDGRGVGIIANLIDQMKGVDLLSAPKITTKNRTAAKIEVVRELRYPTEFERPELSNNAFGLDFNGDGFIDDFGQVNLPIPATPSNFEMEPIGVTMDVTPTLVGDRRIDLDLKPVVTDFEGFINYGQNITEVESPGQTTPTILAIGIVNQPVFNRRALETKLQVVDGQTVVIGGLIREDRQKLDDKIPGLGDLPLIGRLFHSKFEKTIKRNLLIFVTARLVRSNGKLQYALEPEEIIETPAPLPVPLPVASAVIEK
jgi:general secretion pathway protein D